MQKVHIALFVLQGSHRLEKYLNLEVFLEKSLKIKSALKYRHNNFILIFQYLCLHYLNLAFLK